MSIIIIIIINTWKCASRVQDFPFKSTFTLTNGSLTLSPCIHAQHCSSAETVLHRHKHLHTYVRLVSYDSLNMIPCTQAQHCSYAKAILHTDRHYHLWQLYHELMHMCPALFLCRRNFTQTDNVSNDNLTKSPCIQAQHCFYLMQKQFCAQKTLSDSLTLVCTSSSWDLHSWSLAARKDTYDVPV